MSHGTSHGNRPDGMHEAAGPHRHHGHPDQSGQHDHHGQHDQSGRPGDHGGHDHSGHDHSGHDHSGHDHSGHDSGGRHESGTLQPDPAHPSTPSSMSAGDSTDSYQVHLDSLSDFGRELDTQIDGITKPADGLAALTSHPMLMGQFGEATSLVTGHQTSVTAMYQLLGQVRQAIVFAKDVTTTVASGYRDADSNVAAGMHSDSRDDVSTSTQQLITDAARVAGHGPQIPAGSVTGLGAAIASDVNHAVGSITTDVTNTVTQAVGSNGDTVTGVTGSVDDAVGSITQGLTGGGGGGGTGSVPGLGGL